jgi:methyl-accepting chemotaxis protein
MEQGHRKFRSLKVKLLTVIGFGTFCIIGILIAYNTKIAHDEAMATAVKHAEANANDYAGQVDAEIEKALNSAHDLAHTYAGVKDPDFPLNLDRDEANHILLHILQGNESYYGVYAVWEPNGFDNRDDFYNELFYLDTIYPNMEGNDSFGHFVPYWFRYNDLFLQEPTYAYGKDWYDIPKQTQSEMLVDPTVYLVNEENVMLVTLEAPIVHDGVFYGLTGVDISINWLQERIKESNLYGGQAWLSVVSNNGTIAATSLHDTLPGEFYTDVFGVNEDQQLALERGKAGSVQTEERLQVFAPILIGEGKSPWQVVVDIPLTLITAEGKTQMYRSIYISLALLVVILLSIFLFVSRLVKPLSAMVKITEDMANGVLDAQSQIEYSNDEVGLMAGALEHLSEGLQRTSAFANKVGEGDLDAEFLALGEKDMLGNALVEMRENLKRIHAEDERRNWVTKGQAEFGEILRLNNDDLKVLSYSIIKHIVKYLDANQGAIYIVDQLDNMLEMTGAYAWGRQKHIAQKFEPGEGLAGQCMMEKKTIYMENVPDDYIQLRSGSGEAPPTSVLLVPLMINDHVEGVIEIASFKKIPQYRIDFLEATGETMASTLSNVKSNEVTKKLLEQTSQAREEIQSTEEELRQNQEELQATHEELDRTVKELRNENKALRKELKGEE